MRDSDRSESGEGLNDDGGAKLTGNAVGGVIDRGAGESSEEVPAEFSCVSAAGGDGERAD